MLIAWDTVAASVPQTEMDRDSGKRGVGDVAAMMSSELKKFVRPIEAARCHFMMLNQIRTKIGVMFGPNMETPGGKAPKFYSSLRLQFFGGKAIKDKNKQHTGKVITIMAMKNRLGAPFMKARVRFDYATGYNNIWSTLEHAKTIGAIEPRTEGYKGRGKEGLANYEDALSVLGWAPSRPIPDPVEDSTEEGSDADESDED